MLAEPRGCRWPQDNTSLPIALQTHHHPLPLQSLNANSFNYMLLVAENRNMPRLGQHLFNAKRQGRECWAAPNAGRLCVCVFLFLVSLIFFFFLLLFPFSPGAAAGETGAARRKNSHRVGAPKEAGRRINGTLLVVVRRMFRCKSLFS